MEFGAAFPADRESSELVERGEALLHDVAEPAQALDVGALVARRLRQTVVGISVILTVALVLLALVDTGASPRAPS
ncbi:hypothetical protein [Streptomyces sp. GD-15H]|uniref:hypothetical protein n=1 Tax=Streptomyces sp. GD-15H TaxID=3129112 RepID=UPI003873254C